MTGTTARNRQSHKTCWAPLYDPAAGAAGRSASSRAASRYWCTDFLVIQRAMAAKNMNAARRTPLIAAIPKMMFPALVILPGMLAIILYHKGGSASIALPIGADGMQLDIRLFMGLLFLILGVILIGYGLISEKTIYAAHSLGQNVNLG